LTRYLVDGMNVIGSRPDGWWRDRHGAMRRLVESLERFAAAHPDDEVAVVLDGARFDLHSDSVAVEFATRRGRDAADDDIAEMVRPGDVVVTSDDELVRRVRSKGALVTGGGEFRRALDILAQ
jgi:uncharacterized protein YaiI (UPF0178 family)